MTDKPTPTYAELFEVIREAARGGAVRRDEPTSLRIARAVLAKWGTPAPEWAEPVAWAATSEDGDVEALGMNQSRRFDTPLYTTPQPTQAQAPSQPGGFSAGDMASAAAQGYRQGYEQRDAEVRGALV